MKSKISKILGVATTVAMLTSLLMIVPTLGMSAATVDVDDNTISTPSEYVITFTIDEQMGAYSYFALTFPTGTVINTSGSTPSIAASPGWYNGLWQAGGASIVIYYWSYDADARRITVVFNAGTEIGEDSQIRITIPADRVTNPGTAGNKNLYVTSSISTEGTVMSAAYEIVDPQFNPLPGLIKVYNENDTLVYMDQGAYALEDVIDNHVMEDFTVELGAGWYVEDDIYVYTDGLTIKGAGSVTDVVVPAEWYVEADEVTFENITLMPYYKGGYAVYVDYDADDILIDGCTFTKCDIDTSSLPLTKFTSNTTSETLIYYYSYVEDGVGAITNCTFDATFSSADDICIFLDYDALYYGGTLDITDNTFRLDADSGYASDWAIWSEAYCDYDAEINIEGNSFVGTGGFGKGIYDYSYYPDLYIIGNSFSGMIEALEVDSYSDIVFAENTVDKCGYGTVGSERSPIEVYYVDDLTISGNTFTNSLDYAIYVDEDADDIVEYIHINGNLITDDNASGIFNDTTEWLDATRNWWGDPAGPADDFNSDYVDADYPLGAVPTASYVEWNWVTHFEAEEVGVEVLITNSLGGDDEAYCIGAISFDSNPAEVEVPSDLVNPQYFDVFVLDAPVSIFNSVNIAIKFSGDVMARSEVWFYSLDAGAWVKCSNQSRNITSGFVKVDIGDETVPAIGGLEGTPFVLVEAPPEAPEAATVGFAPALGAMDVPINTSFTWPAVTGAVTYEIEIAETNTFADADVSDSSEVTAYKPAANLQYDTQYWWRVRAETSDGVFSAWTTAFFTTEQEPPEEPEPVPPVEIVQTPAPIITVDIPPAEEVQVIPDYLLWLIIAIGAVLVVAVIVLIVRTRRIS